MMIVTSRSAKRRHVLLWLIPLFGMIGFTANFEWPEHSHREPRPWGVRVRRVLSFTVASAMLIGCLWALYVLLFLAERFYLWMPASAAGGVVIGAWWLWADFFGPWLGFKVKE